jgi:hypothetical protein
MDRFAGGSERGIKMRHGRTTALQRPLAVARTGPSPANETIGQDKERISSRQEQRRKE